MRRPTEPEAHRARIKIIEGNYPEGMKSRCSWCNRVGEVAEGRFVGGRSPGVGPVQLFQCASCAAGAEEVA